LCDLKIKPTDCDSHTYTTASHPHTQLRALGKTKPAGSNNYMQQEKQKAHWYIGKVCSANNNSESHKTQKKKTSK